MKFQHGIIACLVVVLDSVAFANAASSVSARGSRVSRLDESREIWELRRKNSHLQRRVRARSPEVPQSLESSCYATSQIEARDKMLVRISEEEDAQCEQELRDGIRTELERYSLTSNSIVCSDDIPEPEQLAITTEINTKLGRWRLVVSRQSEPVDPEHERQRLHQITKNHLGEKRHRDQTITCAKSRCAVQASAMRQGIRYLGAIVGLSAEKQVQPAATRYKYSRLQGENGISLVEESGRLIRVSNNAANDIEAVGEGSAGIGKKVT